jgi:hypothetical protein
MFGKTIYTEPDAKCGISAVSEPFEPKMTRAQWDQENLARAAEDNRQSTLLALLDRIAGTDDAQEIALLAEAYKNVRGY